LIKAALFIGAGILLHRFGSIDEYDLGQNARHLAPIGLMMALGAWGLAGLPPFATFFGQLRIDEIGREQHLWWLPAITIFAEALTAAAVFRFTARVFFGFGNGKSTLTRGAPHLHADVETSGQHSRVPAFMWVPMAILILGAALIAIPLRRPADRFSKVFETASQYDEAVLHLKAPPAGSTPFQASVQTHHESDWWIPLAVALVAIGSVWAALFPKSRESAMAEPVRAGLSKSLVVLRRFQSGRVGDYVAWFALGIAAYGGMLLLLR
jgi:multicomponent Na+:H+ antiporter subunit D